MLTVSASEANQNFSRLMSAAESGEEVVITRRGQPVVRMTSAVDDAERQRRIAVFRETLEQNRKREHQIVRGWTRESLYDRDDRPAG